MKSLSEVKQYLSDKYGVVAQSATPFSSNVGFFANELQDFMVENADLIDELAEKIGRGIDFRMYFEDDEKFRELRDMRKSDPEMFFDIIRKEELFLNRLMYMAGYDSAIVTFNLDDMFKDLDDE